jgi:hypothetical protein
MDRMTGMLHLGVILVAATVLGGCNLADDDWVGDLRTETRTVKLGDAKSVQAEIEMGVGKLKLAGDAKDLLEGDFSYNVERWKPEIEYSVTGGRGRLTVRQHESNRGGHGNVRNEWDLRVNDKVPLDLNISLGVGKSTLTLGSLALNRLNLNLGVGETVVDLTGDWKNDLDARIEGGVGQATIRLPEDTAVRVRASGGIGQIQAGNLKKDGDVYVNNAKSDVTLRVTVEGGIGQIRLETAKGGPAI